MIKNQTEKRIFNTVVTGGLQGIGRAIVERLLCRGDQVVVFDRIDASDQCVCELQKLGATYICVDVSSVESIKYGFAKLSKLFSSIHLFVNNAGVTRDGLAVRMSEQDWDTVLNVNLKGAFFCSQQVIKIMMRQPIQTDAQARGYIVNVSSIVGKTGNPGQVNYAASKAGLMAMTKTLAQEYAGRQILINAVSPGFIQTPMTENLPEKLKLFAKDRIALKRFGNPSDVASMIAFLSSGQADYVTGQILDVTGGMF